VGGGTLHGAFEGTYGATKAEWEAAHEIDKGYEHKTKIPPKGGKSKDDVYDWVSEWKPRAGESGRDFATRICDLKFGKGNYKTNPGTDYSMAKKYADTHFKDKRRKKDENCNIIRTYSWR